MLDPFYNSAIPGHVAPELILDHNIYSPCFGTLDPFESVRRLHEIGAPDVFWTRNNGGHWIALSSAAIDTILVDPKVFSSKDQYVPKEHNFGGPPFVPLLADPPEHAGYRSIVAPLFSPSRLDRVEQRVRELIGTLIERSYAHGACEFVQDFAQQVPVIMFLRFLDLPEHDRDQMLKIGAAFASPPPPDKPRDHVIQTMFDYLRPIVEGRTRNPGDDVISKIATARYRDRPLSPEEKLGICGTILSAGLDTASGALGFFVHFLAESPKHRKLLVDDPRCIPAAIEEMMRRFTGTTLNRRVVKDTQLCGASLRAGDGVSWSNSMFNLDHRRFENPMGVNFSRSNNAHMGFGKGIHYCVGAPLARIEMKVFLEEWLRRIPNFSIADTLRPRIRTGLSMAYESLRLSWIV